jgi:hypothetical protein
MAPCTAAGLRCMYRRAEILMAREFKRWMSNQKLSAA